MIILVMIYMHTFSFKCLFFFKYGNEKFPSYVNISPNILQRKILYNSRFLK